MFLTSLIIICVIRNAFLFPLVNESGDEYSGIHRKRSHIELDEKFLWPNRTIPYRVNMTYYKKEHAIQIDKALREFSNVTCLKFTQRTNESDFVTFSGNTRGCNSVIGRTGGEQFIKLLNSTIGNNCFRLSAIHHEIMHTLGFHHVHQGTNRDNHLNIIWNNVIPSKKKTFNKAPANHNLTDFGIGYDYDSILHYNMRSFSENGEITLKTVNPKFQKRIGQRKAMSPSDILKIRLLYKCDE